MVSRRLTCYSIPLLAILLAPPGSRAGDLGPALDSSVQRIAASLSATKRTTVAVVDFTDLAGQPSELGRFLAEEFSVALFNAPGLQVIDRAHLGALIREQRLSSDGLIDSATARKLGEITGAQALVTGSFTPFGDSVRVTVKVLDAETARMLGASVLELPRTTTIDELLKRTSTEFMGSIGTTAPSAGPSVSRPAAANSTPAAPRAIGTQRVGGFAVTLNGCRMEGRELTCFGTVLNTRENGASFAFRDIYAVDKNGNQTGRGARTRIGSRHGDSVLEPQVPLKFEALMTGRPSGITSATVVVTVAGYCLGRGWADWNDEKFTYRNVPVTER